ncbi:MAG: NAD-dependent epimerase [Betaproteobacteria bacterium]|nr:NAD-dependent epimerase [Betaproteobacteria bacterium]
MRILVTGAAGFIGYSLAESLLARDHEVVGWDNLNDYYSVALKEARLARLARHAGFRFEKIDVADAAAVGSGYAHIRADATVHLAAQAGVRYSIQHPEAYVQANLVGFANMLEAVRATPTKHFVFASTSSVYGLGKQLPFAEDMDTDHPMSFYTATKKANEVMAHSYAHLYGIPTTGLRFFTVYGPWGRPDMALFKFTKAILADETLPVFNHGKMVRDFTYIGDIVEGIARVIDSPPAANPAWDALHPGSATSSAPYRIFNIGNNHRVELMTYIRAIEAAVGKPAKLELLPMQAGDVEATEADVSRLAAAVGFRPATSVEDGVARFVAWYRDYHGV